MALQTSGAARAQAQSPASPGGRKRRQVLVADLAAATILLAALALLVRHYPSPAPDLLAPAELGSSALAALVLAVVAWRCRQVPRLSLAWGSIAVAHLFYAAGDVLWAVGGAKLAGHPLSTPMNLLYLSFYPAFLVGLLSLPRRPLAHIQKLKLVLDLGIVALASALVVWALLLRPRLMVVEGFGRALATLAYPVGDLALVWAVLALLFGAAQQSGGRSRVYAWLGAGTIALVVADTLQGFVVLGKATLLGGWAALAFTASHLLVTLAAVRQLEDTGQLPPAARGRERPETGALYLAFLALGIAWAVVVALSIDRLTVFGATIALAMVLAVLVREVVGLRENTRLYRRLAVAHDDLENRVEERTAELAEAYDTTLEGWSRALELRDHETQGHTLRVAELTVQVARAMGLPEEELVQIRRGALLHDIGKMAIPDDILLKPGPLDEDQWRVMRRHPTYAEVLLEPIGFLRQALSIPASHHERWDGSGYPQGLRSDEIPLAARIFAVVDAWDALTSNRPYRAAWTRAQARDHLRTEAGRLYDPTVVEVILRLLES